MKKNSLNNISKTGFKVPKNYFKEFENTLLSELKLKEMSTNSGFKVPENYFETLDAKILKAIETEKEVKVINLFSWKKIAYVTSVAASLVIMFNVLFNNNKSLTIDSIETASIENYILTEELESNEMASLFTSTDLSDINFISNNFNPETLENFVLDNLEIEEIITNNN
jgi:cell division protein FtsL